MNLKRYILNNGIKPADAIIVKKEKLGLFDHFVIFLGYDEYGEPVFIANYSDGVKILPVNLLFQFLLSYKPVSIRRFNGTDADRNDAISRALSDLRTRSRNTYHLIRNNCEHFANWVQSGIRESDQVKGLGTSLAISGAGLFLVGIEAKNDGMVLGGLLITLLGGIINTHGND